MEKQYTPKKAKAALLSNPAVESSKVSPELKADKEASAVSGAQAPVKIESKPVKQEVKKGKKEEAIARGLNLHASKKHCMYICDFIKNKSIDSALSDLQSVISLKMPIPFKGEIPHRSYPKMMSGRYPVKASKQFIYILKALKGNVIVNSLELEKTRITFASANWASRPSKRGGARFKRTHILLKAREVNSEENK